MDQPTTCSTPSNPLLMYCCSTTTWRTRGHIPPMLHSPFPSNTPPFLLFLPSPIILFINTIIPPRFWHIMMPTMSPSPSPSPFGPYSQLPLSQTGQFISAIQCLHQYRWHDAFEAICIVGHMMHNAPAKHPRLHLLPHINQLFEAIMHHHAYGVDHQVDHAINNLLHLAVRTCQEAKEDYCRIYSDECIRWMTPVEIETRQHLQFYRTFSRYLENYSMSLESDRILYDIRSLLQKLSPTINNLSGWVPVTPPRDIRQDMQGAAANSNTLRRRSQRLRSHHSTPEQPAASNSRQQRRPQRPRRVRVSPPPQLPTPPTQTGDMTCPSTYKTEDYIPSLLTPMTQFSAPCPSQVPKVNEPEEEPTQLVGSRALQFIRPPIPKQRLIERGNLPVDFTSLRPVHIHVTSQRCCSGL
ncbi:hypothetical protein QBC41DRAFT_368187 [Cercophora samala]|uniref:Uncharacterized protein n=1 Tax=Cercophora samala TaxID=330535 RepID=A0AA39Z2Y6_9PEZI|nr:hypothetical protein QBC41DRAFT_368187 [Cercophora samala]